MFHGSMVALVTPMDPNGKIDFSALEQLIEWHIAAKTDALVVVGTTGESVTLSEEEQLQIIKATVRQVNDRIPVIAGTGSNCTAKTIHLTESAMHAGADACLIVTPYYNKPTQEGLFLHYKAVADQVSIPLILYNVPSRTACDLLPQTVLRLADIPNIIGIKEATGKIERCREILSLCNGQLDVYSGDDATSLELMFNGAKGVISVTANVAPELVYKMCAAALAGNKKEEALKFHEKLSQLDKNLFVESNPIPTKWALMKMGLIPSGIRLPLTPLSERHHEMVLDAMQHADIHIN
jgi:4-hydroxy-tetrahydrodipicolinate synthase